MGSVDKISKSRYIAQDKLLLLYVLHKFKMGVPSVRFGEYVLEQRLMDYFEYQQYIHEMARAGLVRATPFAMGAGHGTVFSIAMEGAALLHQMEGLLPRAGKNRVDRTVAAARRALKTELSVRADYEAVGGEGKTPRGVAKLGIVEGGSELMRLELACATVQDARAVCREFRRRPQEVYAKVVALLSGEGGHG